MDYKIEKKDAFPVIVKKKRFSGGEEISKKEIHAFWAECQRDGTIESLCGHLKQDGVFGNAVVGISYDNPCEKEFFQCEIWLSVEKTIMINNKH